MNSEIFVELRCSLFLCLSAAPSQRVMRLHLEEIWGTNARNFCVAEFFGIFGYLDISEYVPDIFYCMLFTV